MIVVDASAVVETLLDSGAPVGVALFASRALHAPDLIGLEVMQAMRGLARGGRVTHGRATAAVGDFAALPVQRHSLGIHEARVWVLRDALSAYDAAYVALAEALDAPLLTADRRLARAAGGLVRVLVP